MKPYTLFVMIPLILFILPGCQIETEPQIIITSLVSLESRIPPTLGENINSQWRTDRIDSNIIQSEPLVTAERREQEEQILASTVRIQMQSWTEFDLNMGREPMSHEAISHGTIISEKHLLTHNHFKYSQTNDTSLHATLYNAGGNLMVTDATFTIVFEDSQTLVLEFTDESGNGLFEILGLPPAKMLSWEAVPLTTITEVAQVDWDGVQATINWVEIRTILLDEIPRLELAHYINQGASGGGVFWHGYHIGNNWNRIGLLSESGQIVQSYSTIVLNSSKMMVPGTGEITNR